MRIKLLKSSRQKGYGIKEIYIENYQFTEDDNYRFEKIAGYYPKGYFPDDMINKQNYWTLLGVNGGLKKALLSENGIIETSKESFTIEPFLYYNDKFITRNEVKLNQKLEKNYLPIPSVIWERKDLKLEIKAFADGKTDSSAIYVRYRLTNQSDKVQMGNLYLAIRPFQVNPPWQFLNITGGVAKIKSIDYKNGTAIVNNKKVIAVTNPTNFGASTFNGGLAINYISKNKLPKHLGVKDKQEFASGAFQYSFNIKPGKTHDVFLIIPFDKKYSVSVKSNSADAQFNSKLRLSPAGKKN